MADQELEMMAVIGKIAAALSQSAGHTVEVYKAEESMPNFRVFITTIEQGVNVKGMVSHPLIENVSIPLLNAVQ